MDISNYNIEQCDAVSVLNAILDAYDRPTAKQVTLQQGISQILAAVGNISIDTSDLAKQGTNPNATLSDVQSKIGTPASGQPTDLFAAIAAGGGGDAQESTSQQILAKLQNILDEHVLTYSYNGISMEQGVSPVGMLDIILNRNKITKYSDSSTTIIPQLSNNDWPLLEEFELTNATSFWDAAGGNSWMANNSVLKKVSFPSLNIPSGYISFYNLKALQYINLQKANFNNQYATFLGCSKLIDIVTGSAFSDSRTMLSNWNPTDVINEGDSYITDTEDEFGNPITTNLQQLLYNIRRHIAANLPTRTSSTSLNITFSANVKAAILADTATANAFSSKYWNVI